MSVKALTVVTEQKKNLNVWNVLDLIELPTQFPEEEKKFKCFNWFQLGLKFKPLVDYKLLNDINH